MTFWDEFKKSIYGPGFYREVKSKPLSFSFRYFYILAFILAFIGTVQTSIILTPGVTSFFAGTVPQIANNYPDNLVVTIKDGQASSNVNEPYFMKTPESMKANESGNTAVPENLIVIDTKNQFTEENFTKYNTLALLTKTSIAFSKNNGGIEIYSLSKMPNWTIDKASVTSLVNKIKPITYFMAPLLAVMILVGLMIFFSAKLVYLLLAALIIWAIAKIRKVAIDYKRSYQAGLHAITLPLVLGVILNMFGIQISLPFFSTILLAIVAFINFGHKEINQTAS